MLVVSKIAVITNFGNRSSPDKKTKLLNPDLSTSSMSTIYIDENSGSDITGKGTSEEPYQSLAQAIYSHDEGASFRIRKGPDSEYEEPTPSSLKKAKKNAQGIEKKKKKEEEQAERDAKKRGEEKERREQLLSESKKIVLEEDPTLPQAAKVCSDVQESLYVRLHTNCYRQKLHDSLLFVAREFVYLAGYIV
jgi:hypothetical protein